MLGGKKEMMAAGKTQTAVLKLEFDIYGGNSDRSWEEIRFSDGSVSFSVIVFGRSPRRSLTVFELITDK